MRGAWSTSLALFLIACAPAARVAGGARNAAEPEIAVVAEAPEAPSRASPSPALDRAIAAAVASAPEWRWPRPPEEAVAAAAAIARPEVHLAHPVCVGPVTLKKERPRKATCCYPAMEALKRPIRAIFPALRACYDARRKKDAAGRVVFTFRVEQDSSIQRVCSGESTSVDDEDAVRCMVTELRKARFPAMSDAEVDLCGLVKMSYPVVFEP
jgi:hypothetical protein